MSDPLESAHLKIPYLAAAQAQKHVTHNEALRLLDSIVQLSVLDSSLADPPGSPAEGDRYIVADSATADWTGEEGNVAAYIDGAWQFLVPDSGWLAYDAAAEVLLVRQASGWEPAAGFLDSLDQLGVNATADATNRLSVRSNAVLFSNIEDADGGTGDVRFVVNKEAEADTASLLFQTGFSGRAEVGLAGDDDFVFKVSPDGSAWVEAIRIDKDNGLPSILYDNGASGLTSTTVQDAIDEVAAAAGALDAAKQDADADLAALAALSSSGLVARTGAGTAAARSLAAGAGLSVSNGDGVSGDPTVAADIGKTAVDLDACVWAPTVTNGCGRSYTELGTNKLISETIDLDTSTQEFATCRLRLPERWNEGTITYQVAYRAPSGSAAQTVRFGLSGVAVSNDDAADAAPGTVVTVDDTFLAAGDVHVSPESSAVTIAGTPAAGDLVTLKLQRNVASDDMAGDVMVEKVVIFYTVDALKDG